MKFFKNIFNKVLAITCGSSTKSSKESSVKLEPIESEFSKLARDGHKFVRAKLDAMRTLGYVNRFGRSIGRVHIELEENGNGEPLFDVGQIGSFKVTVGLTKYADNWQSAAESSQRTAQSNETGNESSQRSPESSQESNERAEKDVERAEKAADRAEMGMERAEKVKAWALNMIPYGVRQDARSNMASVMAGIGMDEKITTEGLMHLTGPSDRGIRKTISALKAFVLLVRVGSDRAGYWELVGFEP